MLTVDTVLFVLLMMNTDQPGFCGWHQSVGETGVPRESLGEDEIMLETKVIKITLLCVLLVLCPSCGPVSI